MYSILFFYENIPGWMKPYLVLDIFLEGSCEAALAILMDMSDCPLWQKNRAVGYVLMSLEVLITDRGAAADTDF